MTPEAWIAIVQQQRKHITKGKLTCPENLEQSPRQL
jgi:hypothetical protein